MRAERRLAVGARLLVAALLMVAGTSLADDGIRGRFSLFGSWSERETNDGLTTDFSEVVGTLTLAPERGGSGRWSYLLDARVAAYPGTEHRDEKISLYEAWVGVRGEDRRWTLRLGQVWVRELGALGRVGGVASDVAVGRQTWLGQLRVGALVGLEPEILDAGYEDGITKGGVYLAADGARGRRHVLGWVMLRNEDLTERSVLIFNNFIPVDRKLFVYQALEYDLEGPAGLGDDELTYIFVNARVAPLKLLEIQATYHRGRSIDARSIAEDILDGRPVDPARLDGLLFESARARISVLPVRGLRLWIEGGRDRNDRSDEWSDRLGYGLWCNDVLGTGFDLTASHSEFDRSDRSYDATSLSVGRSLGARVYVSLDYANSLSVFHVGSGEGGVVEVRPESERYAVSVNTTLSRRFSLLLTGELLDHDDFEEIRALTGLSIRF